MARMRLSVDRGDEDESARGDGRAAIVWRADIDRKHGRNAPWAVAARRAERAIPNGSPRAQIDGAYAAIGGLFAEETSGRHARAGVDFDGERHTHLRIAGAFGA